LLKEKKQEYKEDLDRIKYDMSYFEEKGVKQKKKAELQRAMIDVFKECKFLFMKQAMKEYVKNAETD
jgi:uncharacterized protein YjgD (DUF1641 family)